MQPLISVGCSVHYWVSCAINKGGFLRLHLCRHTFASLWGACLRFASLWRPNPRGDSCVLGVHLSNVCWGLLFCLRTGIQQFTTEHGMLDSTAIFWEEEGGVQQTRGHQKSCVLSYLKTKINRCIFQEKFSLTLSSYPPPPHLLVFCYSKDLENESCMYIPYD